MSLTITHTSAVGTPLDERDAAILAERQAAFLSRSGVVGPQQGDVVEFRDGTRRRVAYAWPESVQTGRLRASYYLGRGYMSHSGSCFRSVPRDAFAPTDRTSWESAWFFHHDHRSAHNGVDVLVDVPVWTCGADAPSH
jgi:hypothetical protein